MRVQVSQASPEETDTDLVAVGLYEGDELPSAIAQAREAGEAKSTFKHLALLHPEGRRRALVVGLGKREETDPERLRVAAALAAKEASRAPSIACCPSSRRDVGDAAADRSDRSSRGSELLPIKARVIVEGALSGLHRARVHGSSVEFAEHKEYSPGDELRHVDWKAYAKLDRYYVKQFEQESQLTVYLVLDASASMKFAGGGLAKLEYARPRRSRRSRTS